jgi:Cof subfamily protein (haloacid dehalogenase superfamily)
MRFEDSGDPVHSAPMTDLPASQHGRSTTDLASPAPALPRIAFIDMDETLLAPDKTISAANVAAIEKLRAAGVEIAIASGRHHLNIITQAPGIGNHDWTLSSHGAVVRHARTGELLLELTMSPERVEEICQRGREIGMTLIAYHREGAFIEKEDRWIDIYARNAGWMPQLADFRDLPHEGFQKILWSEAPERVDELLPVMQAEYAGELSVLETSPELLEFFSPRANKAVGAQALAARLGIDREHALAFGDGTNDVELLAWAGVSVAMDHGRENARAAARFVSPEGIPEESFARAVEIALRHLPHASARGQTAWIAELR